MLQLLAAGALSLPALLVAVLTAPVVALLSIPSLLLLKYRKPHPPKSVIPDHVVITGGSSGIGFALAKECVVHNSRAGGGDGISKITILARNQTKLDKAKKELETLVKEQNKNIQIRAISVSVSDYKALDKVAKELVAPEESLTLFNCAGYCHPGYWEDIPPEQYQSMVNTNQLGSMYATRAFLNYMTSGLIVLCSSAAGQVGVFGFTGYAPTKYALRGFAEALHQELCMKPINVQLVFPIDTDTEGYQVELELTPAETKAISDDAGGLSKPEDVARRMFQSTIHNNPNFLVYFSFEGWMLTNFTAGMSPVTGLWDAVTQVALSGIFRYVSLFYLNDWWRTFAKMDKEKAQTTKDQDVTDKDDSSIKKD